MSKRRLSPKAEVRKIIQETIRPPKRLKIGSEIQRIAREAGGKDELNLSRRRSKFLGADFT